MNPDLRRLALTLFRAVTDDDHVTWEAMSDEEREDAIEWARLSDEHYAALGYTQPA